MDGSVLAVLAAYQNNLMTSKMMTSQVAQWFPTLTRENTTLDGKELTKGWVALESKIDFATTKFFSNFWFR